MEKGPIKVLLITSDEDVRLRLRNLLGEIGSTQYEVHSVATSSEGLERLSRRNCDACLLDLTSVKSDGIGFLRELEHRDSLIPAIVLLDSDEEDLKVTAIDAGALDYLVKERMTPEMLQRSIRYCMECAGLLRTLHETETEARKLALVARRTDNAVIITDAAGRIEWVNDGFTRITEYTLDEVVGKKPGEVLQGPETDPATVEFIRRRLRSGQGFNTEIVNYSKSGRKYWLAIEVQPIFDRSGELAKFMAIESDITERKETEEALREREERIRAIVDNLVDGIVTSSERGIIESFSPAAERIFGYTAEEVIGQNVTVLMPEPYRSEHDRYISRYLETGEAHIIGIGREAVGERKDASVFPLYLAVSEVRVGGRRWFVGIVRDITEQKRLEELKDEFLQVASHDMKNPLNSILGFAQLVRQMTPPGKTMSETSYDCLERIVKNSHVMKTIVEDFLDFHALEDGKLRIQPEPCDLNGLARETVDSNTEYAAGKQIALKLELASGLPQVSADSVRVRQVVQNLIDNAVKFSPPGTGIVVSTRLEEGEVGLAVSDSGPGLTEEDMQKVFRKYARLSSKPTAGEKSSGLGLAICKQLIEAHGGRIGVRNNPDRGATFWFRLPVAREEERDPRRNSE